MTKKEKDVVDSSLVRQEGQKITREQYYAFMRKDITDYTDLVFSPAEIEKVTAFVQKLSTGAWSFLPMVCAGDKCPAANRCPLQQIGKAPVGKSCLIETQLLNHWVAQYMEEYDVEPFNFTEVGYCNELAEIEILLLRINNNLSKPENAELMIEQAIGFSGDGEPIIQKQISPLVEQKDRLSNRRSRVIKLMVGDRQEKYKKEAALKIREAKDPSSNMADMRRRYEELSDKLEVVEVKTVLAENKINEIDKLTKVLTPENVIDSVD